MSSKIPITVAQGDGIGPEIMESTLSILQEAGAQVEIEMIEIGEKVYQSGNASGMTPAAWESVHRTKVLLKGPLTAPAGALAHGDLTTMLRKTLGLFANVRACVAYDPYVETKHPKMDVVMIRENEEDVYGGIEHRQSSDVAHGLRLISRPGAERIVRYAFDYATAHGRKKVTCFTNDSIMRMTDGLFHHVFDEIGTHYPEIEKEHWNIDIGAAKLADTPELFDVVVLPNLYGDILSAIAAQIAGSIGLVGCSNIGQAYSMFEAGHGSSPRRAGQNLANPSGLFLGGVQMLVHIGQVEAANRAHNAWLKTIEDGIHTYDLFAEGVSKQKVGTKEFTKAVIERLGQVPIKLKAASAKSAAGTTVAAFNYNRPVETKQLIGADVFVEYTKGSAADLGGILGAIVVDGMKLEALANRGVTVWPDVVTEIFCTDSFCCRFRLPEGATTVLQPASILALLDAVIRSGVEFTRLELLYNFDGKPGFTAGQG